MNNLQKNGNPSTNAGGLIFRGVQGEGDYPLLLEINRSSRSADRNDAPVTLENIADALAHMDGLTPAEGVLVTSLADQPEVAVGYSRLGWYSSGPETCLYYQVSFLRQEYRQSGFWPEMVHQNERRLLQVAAGHPPAPERFYQAWASDYQKDWIAVLERTGYRVVRRFHNMLYSLGEAPNIPLPDGFEIRPVTPKDMHSVWKAQREMNIGLFENVAEDWLEEKYPTWLANPSNNPRFWQVAWAGNQLAGMVLAHIDDREGADRKHGYTEHIYVRPRWQKRGLASALIARSLQILKEHGAAEAELGVDAENESGAFNLYQKMGYKTFSTDTWFRKPMQTEKMT